MYCKISRALARTVSACLFGLIVIVCTGYGQGAEAQESCTMPASLVQIIDTSRFTPPSPDTAGLTYLSSWDTLLASDSEVSEIPALFTGMNLLELKTEGLLLGTLTAPSSSTPTGVAYNPANEHLFFSDDVAREIWELDPGPDELYDTADDIIASFDTKAFASDDPQGVTFDSLQGFLYVVDGRGAKVFEIDPGTNGLFDGVSPAGDDQVTRFDTASLGVTKPEGIAFDSDNGLLWLIGTPRDSLALVTTTGALVRTIDVSAANAEEAAGLAYAPGSLTPSAMSIYIAGRGVDHDSASNESEGKIYELSIPPIAPGNTPPTVDAGLDQTITFPGDGFLDGIVYDDVLTTTWSQISGPGTVAFADAGAVDTTASFSAPGTYVLRLAAGDGELCASDEVTIIVTGSLGEITLEIRLEASSDDAEERDSGKMNLTSADLELVFEGGGDQTVGMRFNGVDIPQGAKILGAYVQFQADEIHTGATELTIQGEDTDHAATFLTSRWNISPRPRTTEVVRWSPVPWTTVGEAGLDQQTPDIASVLQEIVDRPGWSSGNSLVIIIHGTGERVAESVNGDTDGAPLLHVEYSAHSTNQRWR